MQVNEVLANITLKLGGGGKLPLKKYNKYITNREEKITNMQSEGFISRLTHREFNYNPVAYMLFDYFESERDMYAFKYIYDNDLPYNPYDTVINGFKLITPEELVEYEKSLDKVFGYEYPDEWVDSVEDDLCKIVPLYKENDISKGEDIICLLSYKNHSLSTIYSQKAILITPKNFYDNIFPVPELRNYYMNKVYNKGLYMYFDRNLFSDKNNRPAIPDEIQEELISPDQCIYYTTSDNSPISMYQSWDDNEIIRNTYKNGRGCIICSEPIEYIPSYAFYYNSNLTSITIPNSVTSIGNYAFNYCYGLTSVTIGSSVTNIGHSAFYYCTTLTSITIPNSVISIDDYAFYHCPALTSIIIPNSVISIGNYTFYECSGLTSVTIGSSVTSIGDSAFRGCSVLTSVTIGSSVTSIGDYAFSNCYGLTSIDIPNSVTSIGYSTFSYCYGLTSITIGDSVTSIGDNAFEHCSNLSQITSLRTTAPSIQYYTFYGVNSNGTLIYPQGSNYYSWLLADSYYLGYYGWNNIETIIIDGIKYNIDNKHFVASVIANNYTGNIIIPSIIEYNENIYNVVDVGSNSFSGCSGLTSIDIPNSVTSIGSYAFNNCSGLTSINIPNSVTSIGNYAFEYCSGLTSITIPNSVTSIKDYTFYYCSKLTSITISNSVTSIGNYAFYDCYKLTSITIPNSVTSIGNNTFQGCSGITSITIPDSVTSIGDYTFQNCNKLNQITFLATIAPSISMYTFFGVASNGTLIYPQGSDYSSWFSTNMYYLGYYNWFIDTIIIDGIKYGIIYNSQNISVISNNYTGDIIIPSIIEYNNQTYTVTSIGNNAFQNCSGLTSITISNSVTSIKNYAFSGCSGLTSITIPNSVTSIGYRTFEHCSGLTSIIIGSSVTSIGQSAFYGCSNLSQITSLATTAPSINSTTFQSVKLNGILTYPSGSNYSSWLSSNSYYLGYNNWNSTEIIIDGIKYGIQDSGNGGLNIKVLSNNYTGDIIIPSTIEYNNQTYTVTSIGDNAFSGCSGLTSITIPNSVTSIGNYAFYGCSGLTSITIPSSVTSIRNNAFRLCNNLRQITSLATTAPYIQYDTFQELPTGGVLICPTGSNYNNWMKTDNYYLGFYSWDIYNDTIIIDGIKYGIKRNSQNVSVVSNNYTGDIIIPSTIEYNNQTYNVTRIGKCAFYNSTNFTSITIPNSVTSIDDKAFYYCTKLTSITISNSVTSIGNYAFYYCTKLTSITIPNSVTSIGNYAFDYCSGLTSITLSNSMTSIGYMVFGACTSLTSITIPNSVTSISPYAFYYCTGLTSINIPYSVTSIGYYAFYNCSNLSQITSLATTAPSIDTYTFYNVKSSGILIRPRGSDYSSWGLPSDWVVEDTLESQYLTIVSREDNNTIGWKTSNASLTTTISISTDNGQTWVDKTSTTSGTELAMLNNGDKILIKGSNICYSNGSDYNNFTSTKTFDIENNIMSLIYGDNFIGQTIISKNHAFYRLLYSSNIINTNKLVLPATTLAYSCYLCMFENCINLIASPIKLPATTFEHGCYEQMFKGCTNLTTAPELPATTLARSCYYKMFYGCTSLTTAPVLHATTLSMRCYYEMFYGCTNLNYIKCLATNISATECTSNWVTNVLASGTFIKHPNMTSWPTGNNGIPSGWTVQDYQEAA